MRIEIITVGAGRLERHGGHLYGNQSLLNQWQEILLARLFRVAAKEVCARACLRRAGALGNRFAGVPFQYLN